MFSHMTEAQLWIAAIATAIVWFIVGYRVANYRTTRQKLDEIRHKMMRASAIEKARKQLDDILNQKSNSN